MFPIALSPCPNDTYLFWAWIQGLVGTSFPVIAHYADIDTLNSWAMGNKYPLMKVSINMFGNIRDRYYLLPVGVALGFGVGPKIISRTPRPNLATSRIAIPGKQTSANLLFDIFFKAGEKIFCSYDSIFSLLHEGEVDAGVIIHESRFTFPKEGFYEVADLGTLWEKKFSLPLPLGGIVLRKDIDHASEICTILQDSLRLAKTHSKSMYDFILSHSKEKDLSIVQKHIDLYVTDETHELSAQGKKAIDRFIDCGIDLGHYHFNV